MASIINMLGTGDFNRLRLGIGHPGANGSDVVNWVLGRPAPAEEEAIARVMEVVPDVLLEVIVSGIHAAMNKFNGKNPV